MIETRRVLCLGLAAFSLFTFGSARAYDEVQFTKSVSILYKKTVPALLRSDAAGRFWLMNADGSFIQRVNEEGKTDYTLRGGKKTDLFRQAVDFSMRPDGSIAIADAGNSRIVFLTLPAIEGKKKAGSPVLKSSIDVPAPTCLAVSHDDAVAVGDGKNRVVHVYSFDGVPLHALLPQDKDGFKSITSMAYGLDGVLWVLDAERGAVHRFSADRKWLGATSGIEKGVALTVDDYGYAYVICEAGKWFEIDPDGKLTGTFGARGKNPGQLSKPVGLTTVGKDQLWISEQGVSRLQCFKVVNARKTKRLVPQPSVRIQVRSAGPWKGAIGPVVSSSDGGFVVWNAKRSQIEFTDETGKLKSALKKQKGKNASGFVDVAGVAVDSTGALWISDRGDNRVKRLATDGSTKFSFGEKGKKDGTLKDPGSLFLRADGSIIVADKGSSRVQVFTGKGLFQFALGSQGKGKGKYKSVDAIACNADLIALMDNSRKSLMFFDNNGKFVSEVANTEGSAPLWKDMKGLAVDANGRFYVLDAASNRVRLFDTKGKFLADFTATGDALCCASGNRVLVAGEKFSRLYTVHVIPKNVEKLEVKDEAGYLNVSWAKSPDAQTYRVYRSSAGGDFQVLNTSNTLTYVDGNTTPGTGYEYAIAGVNSFGYEGNWAISAAAKASRRRDISLVSIAGVALNPIFTAAFKYYVNHPIGSIEVENNDDHTYRNVKLSMGLKKYTDFPTETKIDELAPGARVKIPVNMTFNESVLELSENTPVQVDIKLVYFDDNTEKSVTQNAPLTLYSRNAISWQDKSRISSFITPRDTPVIDFSRAAVKEFLAPLKNSTVGKPLAKAALLYEAVNALGMSYVPDPKTPYAEVSGKPEVLDYVQYPRETLKRRLGDCDDTTALLSSLLESIGVETALVEMPGHIFLMANLEENDLDIIGLPPERFVEYQGTYWVPIETTKFGKNFLEAWQTGANEVKKGTDDKSIVFTALIDAEKDYPPVTLPNDGSQAPEFPKEKVAAAFTPVLEQMQKEKYERAVATLNEQIKSSPENHMLNIQLGMAQVEGGKAAEARKIFESYLSDTSKEVQAAAHNNLGNLDFLQGNYKDALAHYQKAADGAPSDGGVSINRARAAWKMGDAESAKKYLTDARSTMPDWREFVSDLPAEILPEAR